MAIQWTDEIIKTYIEQNGMLCPFCGGEIVALKRFDMESQTMPVSCPNCNLQWLELYTGKLVGVTYEGMGFQYDEAKTKADLLDRLVQAILAANLNAHTTFTFPAITHLISGNWQNILGMALEIAKKTSKPTDFPPEEWDHQG